jgi:hypothetical protein
MSQQTWKISTAAWGGNYLIPWRDTYFSHSTWFLKIKRPGKGN